ncbi:MAG: hypothetical protein WAM28_04395 [Chlamydiales bacterium]
MSKIENNNPNHNIQSSTEELQFNPADLKGYLLAWYLYFQMANIATETSRVHSLAVQNSTDFLRRMNNLSQKIELPQIPEQIRDSNDNIKNLKEIQNAQAQLQALLQLKDTFTKMGSASQQHTQEALSDISIANETSLSSQSQGTKNMKDLSETSFKALLRKASRYA